MLGWAGPSLLEDDPSMCADTQRAGQTWAVQSIPIYPGPGTFSVSSQIRNRASPCCGSVRFAVGLDDLNCLFQLEIESFSLQVKISGVEFLASECGSEGFAYSSLYPAKVSLSLFPSREAAWLGSLTPRVCASPLPGAASDSTASSRCLTGCPLPFLWTLVEWSKHWA